MISAEEAEARQATSVLELLATLPGLTVTQSGSAGKAASLFSRGTNSNQTLVLWDGVRLNDPFLGGFDWAFASPEGLERVESVRGPFSALYGSGAVGGVVQLVTQRRPGLSARVEGGSRAYTRASAAGGDDVGPLFVSGHGNLRRGEGVVDNDFFAGEEAALRLDRSQGSSWRLGLAARWQRAELGLPFDYLGQPTPRQRQRSETLQLALPFGWQGAGVDLEGSVARVGQDLAVDDTDNPAQLAQDRLVAAREGLEITTIEGDMADLSMLADESFDLVFHPVSNIFAPAVRPVWQEVYRVLRSGGVLLAGFTNPAVYIFDRDLLDEQRILEVRYTLPYSDIASLPPEKLQHYMALDWPLEFSHSLEDQIGGQTDAGLHVVGLFEDGCSPEDDDLALEAYAGLYRRTSDQTVGFSILMMKFLFQRAKNSTQSRKGFFLVSLRLCVSYLFPARPG